MFAQGQHTLHLFPNWFNNFPVFIQAAVVIITLSMVLFIAGISSLFLNRILSTYTELRRKSINDLVRGNLMVDLLRSEHLSSAGLNRWANKILSLSRKNSAYNQILLDQIIFYHHNFTGDTTLLLKRLFEKLKLAKYIEHKLERHDWALKAKGLREIREMAPVFKKDRVKLLINHKNDDLRIEAQATYIRLNPTNPFDFFEHMERDLPVWHQILLFEAITNTPNLSIPRFSQFLWIKNHSLVSFSLKLIAYYQQLDAVLAILYLLDHPSSNIRAEAVAVLGRLDAEVAETQLIARFSREHLIVQLNIIRTIGLIRSGKQLNFLKSQFLQSNHFDIIKATAEALAHYPLFDKTALLHELNPQAYPNAYQKQRIIDHCVNVIARN